MSRQKPEYAANSWQDVAQVVGEYEARYGIRICASLWWDARLSTGGYVEVIIYEGGTVGRGPELVRIREAYPARKLAGQAGAVMWALTRATTELERNPWNWSRKMRTAHVEP